MMMMSRALRVAIVIAACVAAFATGCCNRPASRASHAAAPAPREVVLHVQPPHTARFVGGLALSSTDVLVPLLPFQGSTGADIAPGGQGAWSAHSLAPIGSSRLAVLRGDGRLANHQPLAIVDEYAIGERVVFRHGTAIAGDGVILSMPPRLQDGHVIEIRLDAGRATIGSSVSKTTGELIGMVTALDSGTVEASPLTEYGHGDSHVFTPLATWAEQSGGGASQDAVWRFIQSPDCDALRTAINEVDVARCSEMALFYGLDRALSCSDREAVELLLRTLQSRDTQDTSRLGLSEALWRLRTGRFAEAADAARRELAQADHRAWRLLLSTAIVYQGSPKSAIPILIDYVGKYPSDPSGWASLLVAQQRVNDADGVVQSSHGYLRASWRLDPIIDSAAWLQRQGHFDESGRLLEECLARDAHHYKVRYLLGRARMQQEDYGEACAQFAAAVEFAPEKREELWRALWLASMAAKDWDRAVAAAREIVDRNPSVESYVAAINAYLNAGRPREGLALIEDAPEAVRSDPETAVPTAALLYECGRVEKASEMLRAVIVRDNSNVSAWRIMGACLMRTKSYREAADAYARVLALRPDSVDDLEAAATACWNAGQQSEALRLIEAIRHLDSDRATRIKADLGIK